MTNIFFNPWLNPRPKLNLVGPSPTILRKRMITNIKSNVKLNTEIRSFSIGF